MSLTSKVKGLIGFAVTALLLTGCANPSRMVYSSDFSFDNYDYVFMEKPYSTNAVTSLYGMDIEMLDILDSYKLKIIGNKEYETLSDSVKDRTLSSRMSLGATAEKIVMNISFDDAVTGKTGVSITNYNDGDIFDASDRRKVFEGLVETLSKAIEIDKGLITQE